MYGYRTKHKLLETYLKTASIAGKDGEINPNHSLMMRDFCKKAAGKKEALAAQNLLNMSFEGYFKFLHDAPKDNMRITITALGINAGVGEYFKIKQHEFIWKAAMNILMTASTVVVAIIAAIALSKDIDQTKALEERIKKLEQVANKGAGAGNGSTSDSQNSNQTSPTQNK
jgi:hypothetical protein